MYSKDSNRQEFSAYRLMWMMVLFDLPVVEAKERKEATKFRNFLQDNGFKMVQYSVYIRLLSGKDSAKTYSNIISNNLPKNGRVEIICITDKQYENIISFNSQKKNKKKNEMIQPLLF